MIYYIDIDNTICRTKGMDYENAKPIPERINIINKLYDQGHTIIYWTARGSGTGRNWRPTIQRQLLDWGVKYTSWSDGKPVFDVFVDDKAFNDKEFFKNED